MGPDCDRCYFARPLTVFTGPARHLYLPCNSLPCTPEIWMQPAGARWPSAVCSLAGRPQVPRAALRADAHVSPLPVCASVITLIWSPKVHRCQEIYECHFLSFHGAILSIACPSQPPVSLRVPVPVCPECVLPGPDHRQGRLHATTIPRCPEHPHHAVPQGRLPRD